MSPLYRRVYNRSSSVTRVVLIVLGDLWAALALGTRWER